MADSDSLRQGVATFRVANAFTIQSLGVLVIIGDVVSGAASGYLDLIVPVGSRAERVLPIRSVEEAIPTNGVGQVALTVDATEWSRIAGMADRAVAQGNVLEVRERPEET